MKYKKHNKKYAMGGGIDMLGSALSGLIPQGINLAQSANYKPVYDPTADKGFDWGNVASSAIAGGGLGPTGIISGAMAAVSELIKSNKNKNTTVYGSPGQYAMGGDMSLNNQSFQVNAPNNQMDSKAYPQAGVKLDNNEVVDTSRDIVYSNRIKNPKTGNTFAEDAKKLETAKGKAQKQMTRYKDPFASNTQDMLDKQGKDLYSMQEVLATIMGKRQPNGAPVQQAAAYGGHLKGMQAGGPVDPITGLPVVPYGAERLMQQYGNTPAYDWNGLPSVSPGVRPQSNVRTYPPTRLTPTTTDAYPNMKTATPQFSYDPNAVDNLTPALFDNRNTAPSTSKPRSGRGKATGTLPQANPTIPFSNPFGNLSGPASDAAMYEALKMKPLEPLNMMTGAPYNGEPFTADRINPNERPMIYSEEQIAKDRGIGPDGQLKPSGGSQFTNGDYLQMGAAAASFAPLLQGPQRETPYLDQTQISKQAYDVQPQLYQSNRSYQNAVNGIDTQSPNTRRAIQNALYAQKLNTDSQIVERYQGMNNQAQQQYESRIADQRRYNIGQTTYTNDLNRRNEGAFNTSLDNAFRTVSNFGSGLNKKQEAQDTLALFKSTYGDVYDRIIGLLANQKGGSNGQ